MSKKEEREKKLAYLDKQLNDIQKEIIALRNEDYDDELVALIGYSFSEIDINDYVYIILESKTAAWSPGLLRLRHEETETFSFNGGPSLTKAETINHIKKNLTCDKIVFVKKINNPFN